MGKPYLSLEKDLQHLKEIIAAEQPGPSTLSILKEAEKRNIPYYHLNEESLIRLGQGANQRLLSATITSQTSSIGVDNACDKERTKEILASQLIPVPQGCIVRNQQALDKAIDRIGFPCVIKPIDGNHGRGITTNINSLEKAYEAFDSAKKLSSSVIVEKYITGQDFRFLVINYKLIAVAKRVPAMIVGTGNHTVEELIAKVNQDPHRGEHHENYLTTIKIDQHTLSLLTEQGFSLNCIVPSGQILYLKQTANISTGGTSIDVTAQIHPYNVFLAERIARLMHLDICGIDVIAEDIRLPLNETKGAVLEVNAAPGLRMHLCPDKGIARNVAAPIIDMLYPNNQPSRIPIIAATGLKFNRALIRLISALACEYGYSAGSTSAEGTYIGRHKIPHKQDSAFRQINMVLRDPIVDFGVFECSAEDILEHGLAFDHCNIGIVMNVNEVAPETSDPLYSKDLVHVKEVILRSVTQQGYCILNADVDLVYGMRTVANCNLALFSLRANNPRIIEHCQKNGLAAFVDHQHLLVCKGEKYIAV